MHDLYKVWIAIAVLAIIMFMHFVSHLIADADAQVGQPLWEDQFYDPTSTRDPVEVQIQENVNRYFDNLERSDEQTVTGNSLPEVRYDSLEAYPMVDDRSQE